MLLARPCSWHCTWHKVLSVFGVRLLPLQHNKGVAIVRVASAEEAHQAARLLQGPLEQADGSKVTLHASVLH